MIRASFNHVYEDRKNHFEEIQKIVWNPGMGKTEGMLFGLMGLSQQSQENVYLVATFWRDLASHQRYATELFPTLKNKARMEKEIQSISGKIILLEESWLLGAKQ